MDGKRFDRLTRAFARVGTRRQVVAGAAVVAVGVGGLEAADAKVKHPCRAGRQTCQRDNQCCSGTCRRGREVPLKDRNRCACGDGETQCGNACVDLAHDERNCGSCGTRCKTGDLCCPDGCVDTKTDEQNCGACGNTCGDGDVCCGGTCAALDSDPDNCGACGHACGEGVGCLSGACDYTQRCLDAWQEDSWYCITSTEGKVFLDGDAEIISKVAGWDSDAASCETTADCDAFALCGVDGVECACVSAQFWEPTAEARETYSPYACFGVAHAFACSDPDATPGFAKCIQTVEGDVWGSLGSEMSIRTACWSSDQCDGDWDVLCDNPDYRCGCMFAKAFDGPESAGLYSMNAHCFRDRVTPI